MRVRKSAPEKLQERGIGAEKDGALAERENRKEIGKRASECLAEDIGIAIAIVEARARDAGEPEGKADVVGDSAPDFVPQWSAWSLRRSSWNRRRARGRADCRQCGTGREVIRGSGMRVSEERGRKREVEGENWKGRGRMEDICGLSGVALRVDDRMSHNFHEGVNRV
jgi:hypothetical protein